MPGALARDVSWWAAVICGPAFWCLLWISGQELESPARLAEAWIPLVMIVLVYPVLEEIVFRGGLQPWLYEKSEGRRMLHISAANWATSLVFTAMHFIYHPPLWAMGVFIPSLVFGYFKDRYPGLFAPIVLHVFYNSGYAVLFMRF